MMDSQNVKLCNCAECGVELIGRRQCVRTAMELLPNLDVVAGRIKDRPYCSKCLAIERPPTW